MAPDALPDLDRCSRRVLIPNNCRLDQWGLDKLRATHGLHDLRVDDFYQDAALNCVVYVVTSDVFKHTPAGSEIPVLADHR